MWSGVAHVHVWECSNESSCFNAILVLGSFWLSDFQVQCSLGLEWPQYTVLQWKLQTLNLAFQWGWRKGFLLSFSMQNCSLVLLQSVSKAFVPLWSNNSWVNFAWVLYYLTPLPELISSCPIWQSSGRTAALFSEHHYPSLWQAMRFMKMVMTFFHPPPRCLLGSKELWSLTHDINLYLKTKQLFSFLLPLHCAALGVQYSHCCTPTLQFSVSSWPPVLSSKG